MNKDDIISLAGIHPSRVSNIYLYGSRVYGTNTEESDYDILLVGSYPIEQKEIFCSTPNGKYNIHICVPNKFEDDLRGHDIHCLECIWSPDFARIYVKKNYAESFVIDKHKLKVKLLTQSHDAWFKAGKRIQETDLYRGHKSLYHSLRILMFGIQILKNGHITDFTEGSDLYREISGVEEYEWDYFKDKYFPIKKDLEGTFKAL